jgi:hypothetical protein
VSENGFIDYYELLQLSSNADTDTVERVFRHLAKKFHPDNKESGDIDRFHLIIEAHRTLSNPESRAGYDVKYQEYWNCKWKVASEANTGTAFGDDQENREGILSMLYVQRRRDMKKPGLGDYDVARLLGTPLEMLEFHVWYLKAKGWVERLDTGYLAITALGVDQVEQGQLRLRNDHMLKAGGVAPEDSEKPTMRSVTGDLPEFPTGADFDQ